MSVRVRIDEARELPVMDKATGLTDAYVVVQMGKLQERTEEIAKTLNPVWAEDFELDVDKSGGAGTLELGVWDKDVVSTDDPIGNVTVDLLPLVNPPYVPGTPICASKDTRTVRGWFPVFDTMEGIRGDILIGVEVPVGHERNVFFFAGDRIDGVEYVHGLVSASVVEDDPEHEFRETFRSARTSNEIRQELMYSMCESVRKRIVKRVRKCKCNCVIGYKQAVVLEGETGFVVRGYGVAARLKSAVDEPDALFRLVSLSSAKLDEGPARAMDEGGDEERVNALARDSVFSKSVLSVRSTTTATVTAPVTEPVSRRIYPFLSMNSFRRTDIERIGGLVAVRAVKLARKGEAIASIRDKWWGEVREVVSRNLEALKCTHVIGYCESLSSTEDDEACILSAMGTAVCFTKEYSRIFQRDDSFEEEEGETIDQPPCSFCHVPFEIDPPPFPVATPECNCCRASRVPSILMCTCSVPEDVEIIGKPLLVQAKVAQKCSKADSKKFAVKVGKALELLEDQVNAQLVFKLHLLARNAVFDLRYEYALVNGSVVCIATGTAVFLPALPLPIDPIIEDEGTDGLREQVMGKFAKQKEIIMKGIAKHKHEHECGTATEIALPEAPRLESLTSRCEYYRMHLSTSDKHEREMLEKVVCPQRDIQVSSKNKDVSHSFVLCVRQVQVRKWKDLNHTFQPAADAMMKSTWKSLSKNFKNMASFNMLPSFQSKNLQFLVYGMAVSKTPHDGIYLSTLPYVPNRQIECYLGFITINLIRETLALRTEEGMEGFCTDFFIDTLGIVRSHVGNMGGDALLSLAVGNFAFIQEARDQAYCLISITGDVVKLK